MLLGRSTELSQLNDSYRGENSTLTILYGRSNIGKTSLIREFIKDKDAFYYVACQASEEEQVELLRKELIDCNLLNKEDVTLENLDSEKEKLKLPKKDMYSEYAHLLNSISKLSGDTKILVIEEFQNIVKSNKDFMSVISALVSGKLFNEKVCIILTSSSISWVENSMVKSVGDNANYITSFLKLKELSFVDIVRMFPKHTVLDDMVIYAITGGVPGYLVEFNDKLSLRDNIIQNVLKKGKLLYNEGSSYIKEELRETSLYNTILYCIANGENKLNELHIHTGFGRDKISVYLKNLIEREIVEKVFSYEAGGKEHTRKGLYSIKSGYTKFWFKYIYANESRLGKLGPDEFYDRYIGPSLLDFAGDAFVKVGTEFIELLDSMNRLEIKINNRARWWGKDGNIDIIATDNAGKFLVGKCNWDDDVFTKEKYDELIENISQANIGDDYIYLFSRDSFDDELNKISASNSNVKLISLNDF